MLCPMRASWLGLDSGGQLHLAYRRQLGALQMQCPHFKRVRQQKTLLTEDIVLFVFWTSSGVFLSSIPPTPRARKVWHALLSTHAL